MLKYSEEKSYAFSDISPPFLGPCYYVSCHSALKTFLVLWKSRFILALTCISHVDTEKSELSLSWSSFPPLTMELIHIERCVH